jgi:hypothetical protein
MSSKKSRRLSFPSGRHLAWVGRHGAGGGQPRRHSCRQPTKTPEGTSESRIPTGYYFPFWSSHQTYSSNLPMLCRRRSPGSSAPEPYGPQETGCNYGELFDLQFVLSVSSVCEILTPASDRFGACHAESPRRLSTRFDKKNAQRSSSSSRPCSSLQQTRSLQ